MKENTAVKTIILSTILALAATSALATAQIKAEQDKSWQVYMLAGTVNMSDKNPSAEDDYFYPGLGFYFTNNATLVTKENVSWVSGLGGGGTYSVLNNVFTVDYLGNTGDDNSLESDSIDLDWWGSGYQYNSYAWWGSDDGNSYNRTDPSSYPYGDPVGISSYVSNESCDVTDPQAHPPFWSFIYPSQLGYILREKTQTETYQRYAQAFWHVQTGGKAIPGRKSVWRFGASAREMLDPRGVSSRGITNATLIAIGSLGNLGADSNLWCALPDCADKDITPFVAGMNYYTFSVNGQKYPLNISLTTMTTNANLDTDVPEVCVGQKVTFAPSWTPDPGASSTRIQWTLPDKYVNAPTNYSTNCTTYICDTNVLTNATMQCWYVSGNGGVASLDSTLSFANGQTVKVSTQGSFTVYRPQIIYNLDDPVSIAVYHGHPPGTAPGLSDRLGCYNTSAQYDVNINSKYGGSAELTQLVNDYMSSQCPEIADTQGQYVLDTSEVFNPPGAIGLIEVDANSPYDQNLHFLDGAYIQCYNHTTVNFRATDYIRFQPSCGIFVTLGTINWNMNGTADFSALLNDYDLNSGATQHIDISASQLDSFPVWKSTISSTPDKTSCP